MVYAGYEISVPPWRLRERALKIHCHVLPESRCLVRRHNGHLRKEPSHQNDILHHELEQIPYQFSDKRFPCNRPPFGVPCDSDHSAESVGITMVPSGFVLFFEIIFGQLYLSSHQSGTRFLEIQSPSQGECAVVTVNLGPYK